MGIGRREGGPEVPENTFCGRREKSGGQGIPENTFCGLQKEREQTGKGVPEKHLLWASGEKVGKGVPENAFCGRQERRRVRGPRKHLWASGGELAGVFRAHGSHSAAMSGVSCTLPHLILPALPWRKEASGPKTDTKFRESQ